MTHETEFTQFDLAMEPLINNGFNGMAYTIKILMDSAMKIERGRYLQADPDKGLFSVTAIPMAFKPKTIKTRVGEIQLGAIAPLELFLMCISTPAMKMSGMAVLSVAALS